jgi:hypothetical protein
VISAERATSVVATTAGDSKRVVSVAVEDEFDEVDLVQIAVDGLPEVFPPHLRASFGEFMKLGLESVLPHDKAVMKRGCSAAY